MSEKLGMVAGASQSFHDDFSKVLDTSVNVFSAIPSKSLETHYHFHLPSEEYSSSEYETRSDEEELLAVTARHLREVNHAVQTLTKYVENVLVTIEEREKNEFNR